MEAAAAASAQFGVTLRLTLPAGCVSTLSAAGQAGSVLTLVCGDNLFVNVQPTLVSAPLQASAAVVVAAPAGGPPAASEVSLRELAALADPGDRRGAVDGVLYVERRATLRDPGGAFTAPSQPLSLPSNLPAAGSADTTGQAVEMWLTF